MSYTAFRDAESQAAAEAQVPERFDDGAAWVALAERATELGGAERFAPPQWAELSGMSLAQITEPVTASGLWTLLEDYESLRLAARWVTLAGLDTIDTAMDDLSVRLRAETAPDRIRGLRAAIYILQQAERDPDKRSNYIQLLRAHDALGIALYRKAPPAKVIGAYDEAVKLQPGKCVVIESVTPDLQRLVDTGEWFVESFRHDDRRLIHICRGRRAGIGYIS